MCDNNGEFNILKFMQEMDDDDDRRRCRNREMYGRYLEIEAEEAQARKKQRSWKCAVSDPYTSAWYTRYVEKPATTNRFFRRFRYRFRLPYSQFLELVKQARDNHWFPKWEQNRRGRPPSPLELLILGSLRYTGRGLTFDDLDEYTNISAEVHRQFYHAFIHIGSTILFDMYVVPPKTAEEAYDHMHEMKQAGFHGAVGSTDATHIVIEKCSVGLRNLHMGAKEPGTARTYNITVNHRRRILSTTTGHPSRWNDKTLVRYDNFVTGIREGTILKDIEFELFERNKNNIDNESEVVTVKYKGVWLLVDNGYLEWSTNIPPFKVTSDRRHQRWSQWLESMRKDVECTFGIMKGRWRILKSGIRLHGVETADKIWMTCCALHNWLLEIDGLDQRWDHGNVGDWECEMGNLPRPLAVNRLHVADADAENMDTSGMGHGDDKEGEVSRDRDQGQPKAARDAQDKLEAVRPVRRVRYLSQHFFRERLVEHFDILYQDNKIAWPIRNGPMR